MFRLGLIRGGACASLGLGLGLSTISQRSACSNASDGGNASDEVSDRLVADWRQAGYVRLDDQALDAEFAPEQSFVHSRRTAGAFEAFHIYHDVEGKRTLAAVKLGRTMCGHVGIVHGGATATIADEFSPKRTISV